MNYIKPRLNNLNNSNTPLKPFRKVFLNLLKYFYFNSSHSETFDSIKLLTTRTILKHTSPYNGSLVTSELFIALFANQSIYNSQNTAPPTHKPPLNNPLLPTSTKIT